MRQLNPSTNLILAVLAGLGVLATLTLPWFAAPVDDPTPTDGPVERGAFQVAQVFATSAKGTVTGDDALGSARILLVIAIAVVAVLGIAIAADAARQGAEQLLRGAALGILVLIVVLAVTHPGTDAPVRLHYGMLAAFGVAALMANAAWHGAGWRQHHAAPARPRYTR